MSTAKLTRIKIAAGFTGLAIFGAVSFYQTKKCQTYKDQTNIKQPDLAIIATRILRRLAEGFEKILTYNDQCALVGAGYVVADTIMVDWTYGSEGRDRFVNTVRLESLEKLEPPWLASTYAQTGPWRWDLDGGGLEHKTHVNRLIDVHGDVAIIELDDGWQTAVNKDSFFNFRDLSTWQIRQAYEMCDGGYDGYFLAEILANPARTTGDDGRWRNVAVGTKLICFSSSPHVCKIIGEDIIIDVDAIDLKVTY